MLNYKPDELSVPEVHKLLLGGIGPRPIALVSTVSEDGINNLAPFSFFNVFGANPPIIAFSPSRRGRDSTLKDTYNNLIAIRECVVQSVTHSMVEQVNVASTEYPPDVDEFIKSGLTPVDSDLVKPKRVQQSPFQMECKLRDIVSYGEGGASANIAICEVVKLHISENLFTNRIIDPFKIDLVGRMSGDFYSRASEGVFEVRKPVGKQGIGYDNLPAFIKDSKIYSGNDLGKLANTESIPSEEDVLKFTKEFKVEKEIKVSEELFSQYQKDYYYEKMFEVALLLENKKKEGIKHFFEYSAKCALEKGDLEFAWKAAMYAGKFI